MIFLKESITLKIGIIHPFFDVFGGAEKTTICLIEALKKTNNFTTLYTVEPPSISETENFKIHKISGIKFRYFLKYQRLKKIKKLFKDAENENILYVAVISPITLERTKVSSIFLYCHTTFSYESEFINKRFTGVKGIYQKKMQNRVKMSMSLLKDSKVRIISNSGFTKQEINNRLDKDSIVIYPPVDINKFLKLYNQPKIEKVITVSRFSPEKNLEFIIDIAKNSGLKHEIVGNAKHQYQINLYNDLRKNSVGENISLYCNISSNKIESLLSSAKVYFQPSEETFGIAVVEAISAGCIPIVPNHTAHPETTPFKELRYEGKEQAIEKLQNAISGKYDHLKPELKKHVEKFSVDAFQRNMLKVIQNDRKK